MTVNIKDNLKSLLELEVEVSGDLTEKLTNKLQSLGISNSNDDEVYECGLSVVPMDLKVIFSILEKLPHLLSAKPYLPLSNDNLFQHLRFTINDMIVQHTIGTRVTYLNSLSD